MDRYVARNPSNNCELQIKITGQIKKRLQSEGKQYKGTVKEQAARQHQPDMREVLKQVQENGHIVRPRKKNRLKRELPEPIDFLVVHSSQSQSTDSSQSPGKKLQKINIPKNGWAKRNIRNFYFWREVLLRALSFTAEPFLAKFKRQK